MAISKRLRFEILRRDNHTCRYCGQSAPNVALHIDHVTPVSLGGADEPTNLATACSDCNSGKSSINPDSPLVEDVNRVAATWNAALAQARFEAAQAFDARDQLVDFFMGEWSDRMPSFATPSSDYVQTLVDFHTRGLGADAMVDAIEITASKRGIVAQRSMWNYFCGICWNMIRDIEARARQIIDNGELDNG